MGLKAAGHNKMRNRNAETPRKNVPPTKNPARMSSPAGPSPPPAPLLVGTWMLTSRPACHHQLKLHV